MTVKCIATTPSEEAAKRLGPKYLLSRQAFAVEKGRDYLVFAIEFHDAMPWITIADDYEQLSSAPLCLFEIIDRSVSNVWQATLGPNWSLSLAPAAFDRVGFYEELLERNDEALTAFRRVRDELSRTDH